MEEANPDVSAPDTTMKCGKVQLLQRQGQPVSLHAASDVFLPGKAHRLRVGQLFILLAHSRDRYIRQNHILVAFTVLATRRPMYELRTVQEVRSCSMRYDADYLFSCRSRRPV